MRRQVRFRGIVAALALAGLNYGLWWTGGPSGVASTPRGADVGAPSPTAFRIGFAGDTLIGDGAKKRIHKNGVQWTLDPARPLIAGDVFILNLEAPLTRLRRDDVAGSARAWTYDMHPRIGKDLVRYGVDHVGFANNHAFDRGTQGLLDTRDAAKAAGLGLFGAGVNRDAAYAPLLIDTPHGRVGIVALSYMAPESQEATDTQPGVAFLGPRRVARAARRAREAGADHLVGFVHWGRNYTDINHWQRRAAGWFVRAGYDLVVGHGPHVQQAVGRIGDTVILYSLGNFVFNSPGRFELKGHPTYGLTATLLVDEEGLDRVELRCLQADNQLTLYRPRPCAPDEAADSLGRLGGLVRQDGDVGVVTW